LYWQSHYSKEGVGWRTGGVWAGYVAPGDGDLAQELANDQTKGSGAFGKAMPS